MLVTHWFSFGYRWGWLSEGPISHIQSGLVVLVDLHLVRWGILYHAVFKSLLWYKITVDNETFQLQDKGRGGELLVCQLMDEAPCIKPLPLKWSKNKKWVETVHIWRDAINSLCNNKHVISVVKNKCVWTFESLPLPCLTINSTICKSEIVSLALFLSALWWHSKVPKFDTYWFLVKHYFEVAS